MRAFSFASYLGATKRRQTVPMSTFWKALVVVVLALPVGAYLSGTLVNSQAETPGNRDPVIIEDPTEEPSTTLTGRPDDQPARRPRSPDDGDDDDESEDDGDEGLDDSVEVIEPEVESLTQARPPASGGGGGSGSGGTGGGGGGSGGGAGDDGRNDDTDDAPAPPPVDDEPVDETDDQSVDEPESDDGDE